MKYRVNIEYTVPEWAEVEIDGDGDLAEATHKAMAEFDMAYPEAIEPKVIGVDEIG